MVVALAETALGAALERWMQRQRLNPTSLGRLSGLSRRTVYNAFDTGSVELETVYKLVSGLATDPYTGERDELVYADAFPELLEAAGYPRELARVTRIGLEDAIRRQVRNPDRARQIAARLWWERGERDSEAS